MSVFCKERDDVDVEAELFSAFLERLRLTGSFVTVGEVLPHDDGCSTEPFDEDVLDKIVRAECRKVFVEGQCQQVVNAELVGEMGAFGHTAKQWWHTVGGDDGHGVRCEGHHDAREAKMTCLSHGCADESAMTAVYSVEYANGDDRGPAIGGDVLKIVPNIHALRLRDSP